MQCFGSFNCILATGSCGSSRTCGGGLNIRENCFRNSDSRASSSSSKESDTIRSFNAARTSGNIVSSAGTACLASFAIRSYGGDVVVTRQLHEA